MISVIIPTYNRADSLRVVLQALGEQTLPGTEFEVLVVDDGSSDNTADIARCAGLPNLRYRRQPNQGEIAARNLGVSLATGELLAFLDDDILVSPHYLEALLKAHGRTGRESLVLGNVRLAYRPCPADAMRLLKEHTSGECTFGVEKVTHIEVRSHSVLLPKAIYEEIGGMRALTEDGRNAWGGIDFGYRAHRLGYSVLRATMARAVHNDHGLRSYRSNVLRWERRCSHAVLLLQRYPALMGQIPMLRDKVEIDWQTDGIQLIARKVVKRMLALPVIIELIDWVADISPPGWRRQFETWGAEPHMVRGFHHGLRRYGSVGHSQEAPSSAAAAPSDGGERTG